MPLIDRNAASFHKSGDNLEQLGQRPCLKGTSSNIMDQRPLEDAHLSSPSVQQADPLQADLQTFPSHITNAATCLRKDEGPRPRNYRRNEPLTRLPLALEPSLQQGSHR